MLENFKRLKKLRKGVAFKKNINKDGFKVDEEERAIINIGAEKYDDIFSPYCYKGGDMLAAQIKEYIEKKAETVPLDYDLTLRFHIKEASDTKRKEIKDALKENFETEIRGINKRMHSNNIISILFFIIGLSVFGVAYLILPYVEKIIFGLLDLFSWVFMWGALDAYLLDRRTLQNERLKKYRIMTAKIEIIEFEIY